MKELTKAEEQVMQIIWALDSATVGQVRERFPEPRPARTTVATILAILENKGFITHDPSSRTNIYTPLVPRDSYSHSRLLAMIRNYFDGSFATLTSSFARQTNLSVSDLDTLLEQTKNELDNK